MVFSKSSQFERVRVLPSVEDENSDRRVYLRTILSLIRTMKVTPEELRTWFRDEIGVVKQNCFGKPERDIEGNPLRFGRATLAYRLTSADCRRIELVCQEYVEAYETRARAYDAEFALFGTAEVDGGG